MTKKILCTIPFASTKISGIAFEPTDGGMISVDVVPADQAEIFLSIPGYEEVEVKPLTAAEKKAAEKAAAEAEAAEKKAAE